MPEGKNNHTSNEEGVDFSEVEDFLKDEEKKVVEKLDDEESRIESLESQKESIENQKKEIARKIEQRKKELDEKEEEIEENIEKEKEKVEELKKAKDYLKETEEKAEELKEDIKEKRVGLSNALGNLREIFKRKPESGSSHGSGASKQWNDSRSSIKRFYEDNYKVLLIIPFLMLLLAFVQIGYQYSSTGDFVKRGVELKGGITLTIPEKSFDIVELQEMLNMELGGDISVRRISQTKGLLIEASDVEESLLISKVEEVLGSLDADQGDYSVEEMGSSLGASFFSEILKAIIIAFVLMASVVFITFRVPAPTFAVILSAFSDIVVTLAIFNLTGLSLGKGGIAAFLMIIGYSVDTDILLSTRVLKSKTGSVMDRIYSAMKTGLTMNITTIAALIAALIFTTSEVIRQIMLILLIGMFVDIINTWVQNVGILRLYVERKVRK